MKYAGVWLKCRERFLLVKICHRQGYHKKKISSVQNFCPVLPLLDSVQKPLFPLHLVDQLNISLKGRMSGMNYNLCMGVFRGLGVNHSAPSNVSESYW